MSALSQLNLNSLRGENQGMVRPRSQLRSCGTGQLTGLNYRKQPECERDQVYLLLSVTERPYLIFLDLFFLVLELFD